MESFEISDFDTLFNPTTVFDNVPEYLSYLGTFDDRFTDALCVADIVPETGQALADVGESGASDPYHPPYGDDQSPTSSENCTAPALGTAERSGLHPPVLESRPDAGDEQSTRPRMPQTRLPNDAVQALEQVFTVTRYPGHDELRRLAENTKQSFKRVRNWFSNARARKPRPGDGDNDIGHLPPPERLSQESLDKLLDNPDPACLDPMEAFLRTDVEIGSNTPDDLYASLPSMSWPPDTQKPSRSSAIPSRAPSIASSKPSSTHSAGSSCSNSSNVSCFGRSRRRGRRSSDWRAGPYPKKSISFKSSEVTKKFLAKTADDKNHKPFLCTFCWQSFCTKYDWMRHEASVHAPQESWLCCSDTSLPMVSCTFCGIPSPSISHMTTEHNHQSCASKPEEDRVYYRKDHFIQHLHRVHFKGIKHPDSNSRCTPLEGPADMVRLSISSGTDSRRYGCSGQVVKAHRKSQPFPAGHANLHCGFCGAWLTDWDNRCAHVAAHFASGPGYDRLSWWPERKETDLARLYGACFQPDQVWSCRFHMSPSRFAMGFVDGKSYCRMCSWFRAGSFSVEEHLEVHKLRACDQSLYREPEDFLQHLADEHSFQPGILDHADIEWIAELLQINFYRGHPINEGLKEALISRFPPYFQGL